MPPLQALQSRLGYTFTDESLLLLALTHPSTWLETPRGREHNQRLEFLGDAVLQLSLTRELYARYPALDEGPLTKARSRLVNQRSLAAQARKLDLGPCLAMSHGEEINQGRDRPSNLADAFEALLGATFLDAGFEAASELTVRLFDPDLQDVARWPDLDNPKGELQELLQAQSREGPVYDLIASEGPDHDRRFECAVSFQGSEIARGSGRSKKEAESNAARRALFQLRQGEPEAGGG